MSIIKVENLSKKYIIGHDRQATGGFQYKSLRDVVAHTARSAYQRLLHPLSPNRENTDLEEFWALKDINFEIKQGDRVGIIGRNGAGKSTLLKILSRITEPTTGKITMRGRVASLLEVGTGFHPELTGRENIYLNGAVLGMTRIEIKKKFDEIVAFAEVEKFLDTPVKRYSSGMYVRLAFAVAAHLEPEILLVDEVLAVGDAQFQKKCIGRMKDVSNEGRTVLFVSHNMGAIQQLCQKGIFLKDGFLHSYSKVSESIESYLGTSRMENKVILDERQHSGTGKIQFHSIKLLDMVTNTSNVAEAGNHVRIFFKLNLKKHNFIEKKLIFRLTIIDVLGRAIAHCSNDITKDKLTSSNKNNDFFCDIPSLPLNRGTYTCSALIGSPSDTFDYVQNALSFDVVSGEFYESGFLPEQNHSSTLIKYQWRRA